MANLNFSDFHTVPEILIEKYNALCSQADDPKFIPHFVFIIFANVKGLINSLNFLD